jgi:hypothetical protein
MRVFSPGTPRLRGLANMLAACALLGACAASPWQQAEADRRPEALLDAYLIAHGMARSYAESPGAREAVVAQLHSLDIKAAQAIRDLVQPYPVNVEATAEAVAALTDYAARQSVSAQ